MSKTNYRLTPYKAELIAIGEFIGDKFDEAYRGKPKNGYTLSLKTDEAIEGLSKITTSFLKSFNKDKEIYCYRDANMGAKDIKLGDEFRINKTRLKIMYQSDEHSYMVKTIAKLKHDIAQLVYNTLKYTPINTPMGDTIDKNKLPKMLSSLILRTDGVDSGQVMTPLNEKGELPTREVKRLLGYVEGFDRYTLRMESTFDDIALEGNQYQDDMNPIINSFLWGDIVVEDIYADIRMFETKTQDELLGMSPELIKQYNVLIYKIYCLLGVERFNPSRYRDITFPSFYREYMHPIFVSAITRVTIIWNTVGFNIRADEDNTFVNPEIHLTLYIARLNYYVSKGKGKFHKLLTNNSNLDDILYCTHSNNSHVDGGKHKLVYNKLIDEGVVTYGWEEFCTKINLEEHTNGIYMLTSPITKENGAGKKILKAYSELYTKPNWRFYINKEGMNNDWCYPLDSSSGGLKMVNNRTRLMETIVWISGQTFDELDTNIITNLHLVEENETP